MPEEYTEQVRQHPVAPPAIASVSQDVLKVILDPYIRLEKIRRNLSGQVFNYKTNKYYTPKKSKPDLNVLGVNAVMSILNMYISPESALSNLQDEEIYDIMRGLDKEITSMFANEYDLFEISISRLSITKTKILDNVFVQLKKSQNKAFLEALTKTYTVSENIDSGAKRGGISGFLK